MEASFRYFYVLDFSAYVRCPLFLYSEVMWACVERSFKGIGLNIFRILFYSLIGPRSRSLRNFILLCLLHTLLMTLIGMRRFGITRRRRSSRKESEVRRTSGNRNIASMSLPFPEV